MAGTFDRLEAQMPPAARERSDLKARTMLADMALAELREARHLSQQTLAKTMGIQQAAVSKMERRTDMYISTLRNFIAAMGGQLDIVARFPDGDVQINQFSDLDAGAPPLVTGTTG